MNVHMYSHVWLKRCVKPFVSCNTSVTFDNIRLLAGCIDREGYVLLNLGRTRWKCAGGAALLGSSTIHNMAGTVTQRDREKDHAVHNEHKLHWFCDLICQVIIYGDATPSWSLFCQIVK